MPHGFNMNTCVKCGRPYLTGDYIELGEPCSHCKVKVIIENPCKEVDLTHLVPREKLKQEIQTIMNDALAGVVDIYRYEKDGVSYIRWGRVQKHINDAIDLYWPKEKNDD